ncbi:MAG: hypothetical protein R3B09_34555, partial [Nannocystaceae bacterium]
RPDGATMPEAPMPRPRRPAPPSGPRVRCGVLAALVSALLLAACRDAGPPVDPETGRPLAPPPSVRADARPAPIQVAPIDRDGDGLADAEDRCPDEAEDRDGFEDEDGCPDPDNDRDGVLDVDDQCPNEPRAMGPHCRLQSGCPDDCRAPEPVGPS